MVAMASMIIIGGGIMIIRHQARFRPVSPTGEAFTRPVLD